MSNKFEKIINTGLPLDEALEEAYKNLSPGEVEALTPFIGGGDKADVEKKLNEEGISDDQKAFLKAKLELLYFKKTL